LPAGFACPECASANRQTENQAVTFVPIAEKGAGGESGCSGFPARRQTVPRLVLEALTSGSLLRTVGLPGYDRRDCRCGAADEIRPSSECAAAAGRIPRSDEPSLRTNSRPFMMVNPKTAIDATITSTVAKVSRARLNA
jgi:hypothetical protein